MPRHTFGPDIANGLTVTTGPATTATSSPPAASAPAAPAKPDIAVAFNGLNGTGPVNVEFGLPVYSTDHFNHLLSISVVALPAPTAPATAPAAAIPTTAAPTAALPTTADDWLSHPNALVSKVDVSGQLTGGTATVACNFPNGTYVAKSILTFDA